MYVIPTLGDKHMITPTEKLAYIITTYFSFTEHTTDLFVGHSRSLKKRVLDMLGTGSIDTDALARQAVGDVSALIALSFNMAEFVDTTSATVTPSADNVSYDITVRAGVRSNVDGMEYYIPGTSKVVNGTITVVG